MDTARREKSLTSRPIRLGRPASLVATKAIVIVTRTVQKFGVSLPVRVMAVQALTRGKVATWVDNTCKLISVRRLGKDSRPGECAIGLRVEVAGRAHRCAVLGGPQTKQRPPRTGAMRIMAINAKAAFGSTLALPGERGAAFLIPQWPVGRLFKNRPLKGNARRVLSIGVTIIAEPVVSRVRGHRRAGLVTALTAAGIAGVPVDGRDGSPRQTSGHRRRQADDKGHRCQTSRTGGFVPQADRHIHHPHQTPSGRLLLLVVAVRTECAARVIDAQQVRIGAVRVVACSTRNLLVTTNDPR